MSRVAAVVPAPVRIALLLVLLALGLATGGCGNKEEIRTLGETEGLYIDVGPLEYQVQVSRQLNPTDVEDRAYLEGLPASQRRLGAQETFFGVFMRVQNLKEDAAEASSDFEIVDTVGRSYRPLALANEYGYRAGVLEPEEIRPDSESTAGQGPTQGSLLVFKLTYDSLENRPLELKIKPSGGPEGEGVIDLDV